MDYYSAIKNDDFMCRAMDESGNRHSQQTDTRTENQRPHVLPQRLVLNNENTWSQGGEHHTLGSVGGTRGGITWGEMPEIGDRDGVSKPHCHVCTYTTILHALHIYPRT